MWRMIFWLLGNELQVAVPIVVVFPSSGMLVLLPPGWSSSIASGALPFVPAADRSAPETDGSPPRRRDRPGRIGYSVASSSDPLQATACNRPSPYRSAPTVLQPSPERGMDVCRVT